MKLSTALTVTRRSFTALLCTAAALKAAEPPRPNILWITCEDIGPELATYGDRYSVTPNLDRLAARSVKYSNVWSNAPVCAPARTTIISGLYPPSTGSEHMRSMTHLPPNMKMFPCYLREAGYYTTNNDKEDYNLEHTGKVWDDSSKRGHWRNRTPGQPFFSVFNIMTTHESKIFGGPHKLAHDPAEVRVPAYHPDTPEVRKDWARYYDNITTMDREAAVLLKQLEDDGLADDTIVFFYGDHGAGMPRSKRFPYNSGLRVPMIVHVPEKFKASAPTGYKPNGTLDRMIGFVDLAPTVLSAAGIKPPMHMQGNAFLGSQAGPERAFNYGFRGRMDERYDLMRSVTDGRYVYIRNYMPHKVYGQYIGYMFQTPTTQVWKKLYDEGKLNAAQRHFWETKPVEELYDLANDRDEVNNLAGSAAHRAMLDKLRAENAAHVRRIRDVGFLPEGEIHTRAEGSSPYEVGHDEKRYPMERVIAMAELASGSDRKALPVLSKGLEDPDSAVRYWAATGILMLGASAFAAAAVALRKVLQDPAPYPRALAAECLARFGTPEDLEKALDVLANMVPADKNGTYVSLWVLLTITDLGDKAKPILARIKDASLVDPMAPNRAQEYAVRAMTTLMAGPNPNGVVSQ